MNQKHEIVFLDIVVYVDERKLSSKLCQKPRDTGTILNFRSCDPLQHKENIIEDTIILTSKKDLPLSKCYGTSRAFDWLIIEQCNVP